VVVPRLVYRGYVSLPFAREKAGKSTLLTGAAAAVTQGADFLGERCAAGPVLWVSADHEHASTITQRAQRFGARGDRFHVLWPRQAWDDLLAAVDRVAPVLLIVDTLAAFAAVQDPHASAEWRGVSLPLIHLARERELGIAVTHHAVKAEAGGYRDSSAIGGYPDLLLEVKRDHGNAARRHITPLGRWPAEAFTVELLGDRYHLVAAGELSLDAQVLAWVAAHPRATGGAIRTALGARHNETDAAPAIAAAAPIPSNAASCKLAEAKPSVASSATATTGNRNVDS